MMLSSKSLMLVLAVNLLSAAAELQLPISLGSHNFDSTTKGDTGSRVVIFCDITKAPNDCKHLVESFKKMTTIWSGTGLYKGANFGEVKCDQEESLCVREGVSAFPTAVHYHKGVRAASWTGMGSKVSVVWDFVDWVKTELDVKRLKLISNAAGEDRANHVKDVVMDTVFAGVAKDVAMDAPVAGSAKQLPAFADVDQSSFSLTKPFTDMDHETAAVGWCLVLGFIGIIGWVIVEGFELWPAVIGKQCNPV